ncbi:MAG: helix-turn-helix transcriptional regulator [Hyphomonadaceae bacterium]|nr:helix-turn-helix transcriptional regulator [Clostridia bacterium]
MNSIGKRIKFLRNQQNITVDQLASHIGMKKGSISCYENGKYEPSAQTLISLARFFDVSCDWLLTGNTQYQNLQTVSTSLKVSEPLPSSYEYIKPIDEKEETLLKLFRKLGQRKQSRILKSLEIDVEKEIEK